MMLFYLIIQLLDCSTIGVKVCDDLSGPVDLSLCSGVEEEERFHTFYI